MDAASQRAIDAELLSGIDDPRLSAAGWGALIRRSSTAEVFQTRGWHRAWYATLGGDAEPVLVLAARDGEPAALLPFVLRGGMAFLAGCGSADYLDVIGESSPAVLTEALGALISAVPGLVGVRLHHIPDFSPTPAAAEAAAEALGWQCFEEEHEYAFALRVDADPDGARAAADKKSLRRHERALAREGVLEVRNDRDAAAVLPQLDAFFDQHVRRWAATPYPSLFCEPAQRRFYEALARESAADGTLHFTSVRWNDAPVAFHFGFANGRSLLWYKPAFAVEHARRSPGEVLLRHLILEAIALRVDELDLGMGAETFKQRFATHGRRMRTYGLYA